MMALQTQRPKVTTGWSEVKTLPTKSELWQVVIVLGWNLLGQKSIFTLNEPVYCLFASPDNIPLECKISFFWTPQSTGTAPEGAYKSSHYCHYHVNC